MNKKVGLGTAQLGMKYGVNNTVGKPNEKEAFEILDCAKREGIRLIDTADAYGNSADVIGNYITKNPNNKSRIVSKFKKKGNKNIQSILKSSLQALQVDRIYGYMYHNFHDYYTRFGFDYLLESKKEGIIQKVGVSLYSDEELEYVVDTTDIDLVQLPFNLLDNSRKKQELLTKAKDKGIEIHARSVFLQGLFFMSDDTIKGKMEAFLKPIEQLRQLSNQANISIEKLAINYVIQKAFIDNVIIGVDSADHLLINLRSIGLLDPTLMDKIEEIQIENKNILNPSNW